jgi:hypothetical protein
MRAYKARKWDILSKIGIFFGGGGGVWASVAALKFHDSEFDVFTFSVSRKFCCLKWPIVS